MSNKHIARIMHDFLHRGVQRNVDDLLGFNPAEEFFTAKSKPSATSLIAFALGYQKEGTVSLDQFERTDFVSDRKLRHSLTAIVDRMPTLVFQLIPLVLVKEQCVDMSFLLRVRKAPNSMECIYLDLTNRKYDNFPQFLNNNRLPPCILWYPENGTLQYDHSTPAGPMMMIASLKVTNTSSSVWDGLTIVGSALSTVLAFTPLGATVTVPLMLATSAVSSGLSFAKLLDSCKHEKGTIVAGRAFALAFHLTTFASAGLTATCRVEKLRRLLPAEKLQQLEKAEQFLKGTRPYAATGSAVVAVIGKVGGWQTLSTAEWFELAAILCFAYREDFNQATAVHLFDKMQRNGVWQFFKTLCPNVSLSKLRLALDSPALDQLLRLIMEFLKDKVDFRVDDNFSTIYLFGYELEFERLFKINWPQLKGLLLFLQNSANDTCRADTFWSQTMLNNVINFLQIVCLMPNPFCTLVKGHKFHIRFGNGHRFSSDALRAFLTAKGLNRIELLRQLASLNHEQTDRLNELRESRRITDGDEQELFNWLGQHHSSNYQTALLALLSLADALKAMPSEQSKSVKFDGKRIVVSPLLGFSVEDFLRVPAKLRTTLLLGDESFLRLCNAAEARLFATDAADVWMRTVSSETAIQQLETIDLLGQLFERVETSSPGTPTLASALDYAFAFDNTTVPLVYYSIVGSWKQFSVPLDKRTMQARFLQLMKDAKLLGMARYISVPYNGNVALNDGNIIALTRTAMLANIVHTEKPTVPFGPIERAACWLGLLPTLRDEGSRKRLIQTILSLAANGTGTVLKTNVRNAYYLQIIDKRMVMFATEKDKLLVEVILPCTECANFLISLYMCGSTICSRDAGETLRLTV